MKEQLTLNDLCSYLPYGLKFEAPVLIWTGNPPEPSHDEIGQVTMTASNMEQLINHGTPIFRNLATDLTREITHRNKTFNPYDVLFNENPHDAERAHGLLIKNYGFKYVPYWIIEKLRFWHFWLGDQSYFEKGIILDYNDVNGL